MLSGGGIVIAAWNVDIRIGQTRERGDEMANHDDMIIVGSFDDGGV